MATQANEKIAKRKTMATRKRLSLRRMHQNGVQALKWLQSVTSGRRLPMCRPDDMICKYHWSPDNLSSIHHQTWLMIAMGQLPPHSGMAWGSERL